MAFVFQKVATADDAKAPAVPPPERKETGGFRAGGGAGGAGGRGPQRYGNDKVGALCDFLSSVHRQWPARLSTAVRGQNLSSHNYEAQKRCRCNAAKV